MILSFLCFKIRTILSSYNAFKLSTLRFSLINCIQLENYEDFSKVNRITQ